MDLYPYQQAGVDFLIGASGRGALLADEPGLGKTRQAIGALAPPPGYPTMEILVVCPASAVGVWKAEIEATGAARQAKWQIVSFNKAAEIKGTFEALIVDEAHYAKTRDAKRTIALFGPKTDGVGGLVERAGRVILLSGTPTPNNPSEIWPLARACFPAAIMHAKAGRPMSYWEFVSRYCKVKIDYLGHSKIVGGKNLAELRDRLAPYVLRRRKADVLPDLPPVRFSALPVVGRAAASGGDVERIAAALARGGAAGLREIAPHVASFRRACGLAKVEGVLDWTEDWFKSGGGKLVLFAHHKDVIRAIETRLRQAGVEHVVVTGATPPAQRAACAEVFNTLETCKVFVGQNEAAGTAVTLTGASTLLNIEPAWTPGVNDQIWQRIHRIGQANACDVRYPTLAGSIDEQITRALLPKQGAIDALWN